MSELKLKWEKGQYNSHYASIGPLFKLAVSWWDDGYKITVGVLTLKKKPKDSHKAKALAEALAEKEIRKMAVVFGIIKEKD